MASLGQTFDATAVDPSSPREVIPAGKYPAQIVASEMKATSAGTGQYLELELEVIDGEYHGKHLWDRLNLVNPNATAVEIAQRTLSAICHAVGVMAVTDSEQLHFKPLTATVKVCPAGPDKSGVQRDAQNEIGGYSAANAVSPGATARTAAPARVAPAAPAKPAAAAPTAGATPPWRRTAA